MFLIEKSSGRTQSSRTIVHILVLANSLINHFHHEIHILFCNNGRSCQHITLRRKSIHIVKVEKTNGEESLQPRFLSGGKQHIAIFNCFHHTSTGIYRAERILIVPALIFEELECRMCSERTESKYDISVGILG